VTLLTAIGQQIGVAIENVRLYEQVQSIAALEERGRIGRELHDGLAQMITSYFARGWPA
jgi:two-component system nitrate/nitrite sensor histidine kinase NarX